MSLWLPAPQQLTASAALGPRYTRVAGAASTARPGLQPDSRVRTAGLHPSPRSLTWHSVLQRPCKCRFRIWDLQLSDSDSGCRNLGDWLVDWLYPALPALGAQPSDIVVLNFAVWLNLEEHYNYHLGRCRGLAAATLIPPAPAMCWGSTTFCGKDCRP